MILALDIGSKLGYYIENKPGGGTIDLGKGDMRFLNFRDTLVNLIDNFCIDTVVYEDAKFQQGHAIPIYHGLIGILKTVCVMNNIKYIGIPVGTIKKCFTGKGNCNKEAIMKRCDELNILYEDSNGADSYAVYHTYKELYDGK